jgi:hypothetical protein
MADSPDRTTWAPLPTSEWADTLETLHLFTQVVGKIRLTYAPWLNHSWSVPLYLTASGLTTSLIQSDRVEHRGIGVELAFDFHRHVLVAASTAGEHREIPLGGRSVAAFYGAVIDAMASIGAPVEIHTTPNEIADAIPFEDDTVHDTYDPAHAVALWRAFLDAARVMQRFRAGFLGKASPVHLFWGSFDLATTRFSGRTAPPHPGGMPNFPDDVAREAYSHEVTSVGFWPGNREAPDPIFYAYAYPTPDGFSEAPVRPDAAFWLDALGEFALPHAALTAEDDPDTALLGFFQSTHDAAAELAGWDRHALECAMPQGPDWWVNRPHHD